MRLRSVQHLRRQSDIRNVREKGRRIDCGAFSLWWRFRPTNDAATGGLPRVCVVASIAAVGSSVPRNRARRLLREIFRLNQECLPQSLDLMLVARASILRASLAELQERFLKAQTLIQKALSHGGTKDQPRV